MTGFPPSPIAADEGCVGHPRSPRSLSAGATIPHAQVSQHLAFGTDNLYAVVDRLRARNVELQDTIETYFDLIEKRLPGHGEPVEELRKRRILIDGAPSEGQGLLLQIFGKDAIGPIFFEFIQRKGNEGFGEGNFRALFESIEMDQIRRGVV